MSRRESRLASIILMAIGCWEVLTGNHLSVSRYVDANLRLSRLPSAVFYNTNDFATFLALSTSFFLGLLRMDSRFFRVLGVVLIAIALFLLDATSSRANMLAVACIFVFWFFPFLHSIRTKWARVFLTGILFFSLLAGAILLFTSGPIQSLQREVTEELGSGGTRMNLIKNSLHFLFESMGLGVGAGNAEWYMEKRRIYDTAEITNVHNWWIELLVNYGLVVMLLYILQYGYIIWLSSRILRKNTGTQWTLIFSQTFYLGSIGFFFSQA